VAAINRQSRLFAARIGESMAGYSGTPLAAKLGIKPGIHVCVEGAPDDYLEFLKPLPDGVVFTNELSKKTELVHIFSAKKAHLAGALAEFRAKLKSTAVIWVSWPKKSSRVPTDITEETVRELALPLGFVDIKVCAVTEIWSGLKLVVRKELR
jgi:hypothetical protein